MMNSSSRTAPMPSTAADFRRWLASLDDAFLASILRHRPDTAVPLPPGIPSLATRLLLRASIARVLGECTAHHLAALEALARAGAELGPVSRQKMAGNTHHPVDESTLHELAQRALVYFPDAQHVCLPLEVMPALPTDWSLLDQVTIDPALLGDLPDSQRSILETLAAGGGVGSTRDAAPDADPSRPVPQLLAAGLLHRIDARTVRMPRGVRAALTGSSPSIIPVHPSGRRGEEPATPSAEANEAGTVAGLEVVRSMERLIDELGTRPVELLKDKTVGIRPLATLAKSLGSTPPVIARLIAIGFAARLLGRGEPKHGPEGNFLAPTELSHSWADSSLGKRWEVLLTAALTSPWASWESPRGLDPETSRERLVPQRHHILDIYRFATVPLSDEEFWEDLYFQYPLFAARSHPATINALREEAEWLGLIARGEATAVLHEVSAAAQLTPAPVEGFILQADLTALVPGPLTPELQHRMDTLADVESPGLASVYRLSDASLRRGMDAGMTGEEILAFFTEHSLGPVPQAVEYLVKDVARRHGTLRSGPAMAYVRTEDPALLAQAVHAVPALRQIAPTVAIATEPLHGILEALRAAGFSPAAEDATGASIDARPAPAVLPTPRARQPREPELTEQRILAAVSALRASHTPSTAPSPGPNVDLLHSAARGRRAVALAYADKNGTIKEVTAIPLSVAGGQVDAHVNGKTVRFPLHRITSVTLAP